MPENKKIYVEFDMTPDELPFEVCQTLYFHEAEEFTAYIDWERSKIQVEVVMLEKPNFDVRETYEDFDKRVTFIDDYDDPNGGDSEDDEVEED